jgi:hypothetical protein
MHKKYAAMTLMAAAQHSYWQSHHTVECIAELRCLICMHSPCFKITAVTVVDNCRTFTSAAAPLHSFAMRRCSQKCCACKAA